MPSFTSRRHRTHSIDVPPLAHHVDAFPEQSTVATVDAVVRHEQHVSGFSRFQLEHPSASEWPSSSQLRIRRVETAQIPGQARLGENRSHRSRLQNSLGCGLNSRFPGEHSVVLDCRLRVLGREDSSGEPRSVERRPSTCLHRHRWMTGPGRAPALDRRLADDTLFVTSPGARAGRRSAPARRTCSGTSPSRRRGRGHGDRRTRP